MRAQPSPARWLTAENCYFTKIFVGILAPGQRTPAALPVPVQITLIGAGDATPQPRELKLEKTLQFAEAEIRLNGLISNPESTPYRSRKMRPCC